jgi:hypothetical protein
MRYNNRELGPRHLNSHRTCAVRSPTANANHRDACEIEYLVRLPRGKRICHGARMADRETGLSLACTRARGCWTVHRERLPRNDNATARRGELIRKILSFHRCHFAARHPE